MIYPYWLPRPKCWLKAIELLLYNIPVLFVLSGFLKIYRYYGHKFFITNDNQIIYLKITGFGFGFLLVSLMFSYFHFFFWGKSDPNPRHLKWLPSNQSLIEGFFMFITSLISFLLLIICLLPFLNYRNTDLFYVPFFIIWMTTTAYFYHLKYWLERKKEAKKQAEEASITE